MVRGEYLLVLGNYLAIWQYDGGNNIVPQYRAINPTQTRLQLHLAALQYWR